MKHRSRKRTLAVQEGAPPQGSSHRVCWSRGLHGTRFTVIGPHLCQLGTLKKEPMLLVQIHADQGVDTHRRYWSGLQSQLSFRSAPLPFSCLRSRSRRLRPVGWGCEERTSSAGVHAMPGPGHPRVIGCSGSPGWQAPGGQARCPRSSALTPLFHWCTRPRLGTDW